MAIGFYGSFASATQEQEEAVVAYVIHSSAHLKMCLKNAGYLVSSCYFKCVVLFSLQQLEASILQSPFELGCSN